MVPKAWDVRGTYESSTGASSEAFIVVEPNEEAARATALRELCELAIPRADRFTVQIESVIERGTVRG